MKINVILDTEEYYKDEADDDGDRGLIFRGVSVYPSKYKTFDFEIDAEIGDPVIVLIDHYEDGSTFGSYEEMEVKGVFKTLHEAEVASKKIDTNYGYFGDHIDFLFEAAIIKE